MNGSESGMGKVFGRFSEPAHRVLDLAREEADWCPLVNLFEDEQAAPVWARQRRIHGAVRLVAQATQLGAAAWRAHLWPGATPADRRAPAGPSTPGAQEGANADKD